jgi:hypothetical protein
MSGLQWQACNFRRHTAGFASGDSTITQTAANGH